MDRQSRYDDEVINHPRLAIKDIQFGKIDANNELEEVGEEFYLSSFLQYDKYKISSFLNGENYFICGNKGTGKTALLKYLECKFSEDKQNLVLPIRFKTQFDDMDRRQLRNSGNNLRETVIDNNLIDEKNISYVETWQIFIIRYILNYAAQGEYSVFIRNKELSELEKILASLYSDIGEKIIPRISRGNAAVRASLLNGLEASLKFEMGFDQKNGNVNYAKTVKVALSRFKRLDAGQTKVYVLIDEMELSVRNTKEFKRDVDLIRDLILAIERINSISKERGYNIRVIASIRSEVINHVNAYGYEINKCIEDFGVTVTWFQKGGNRADSPLIKLIENKIHASEKAAGYPESEDIWEAYFTPKVNDIGVKQYILGYSWQRPRDVIRMMCLVQDEWNGEKIISQEMFDRALQKYSEYTWNEIAEELVLTYPRKDDIKAIKKFFTGIEVPFTLSYLNSRAAEMGKIYDYVDEFFKKYKMVEFLERMFEAGIIGNSGKRMIFKFLGDKDLDLTSNMILHKPLRNLFAVHSRIR